MVSDDTAASDTDGDTLDTGGEHRAHHQAPLLGGPVGGVRLAVEEEQEDNQCGGPDS